MNFWLLYIYNIKKTLMISEIILMIRLAMRALLTKHMPPHNSKLIRFLQNMTHFLICWSIFIRKKVGQPMDKLIPRIISVNLLAIHRLMLKPLLNVTVFPNILTKKFIFFFQEYRYKFIP